MDDRNLELEAWLIEAAGEEMMANHLGPNWNKFDEEFGFYPNMGMTVADLVWQHQQAKVEGLEGKLKQAYEDVDTFATAHEALEQRVDRDRSLIQFTQKANKDLIAERDELQKRVDSLEKAEFKLAQVKVILQNNPKLLESILIKKIEQALKGEG